MMKPTGLRGAHKFRSASSGSLFSSVQLVPVGTRGRLFSISLLQDRTPTMSAATSSLALFHDGDDGGVVRVVVNVNNYNRSGISNVSIPGNGIVFENGINATFSAYQNIYVASGVQGISITYQ
tara:strand:+ start:413 stop:781 length:369 start_codon:yes stop_codon:yes gene_type:complete